MLCYIVSAEHPEYVLAVEGENKEEQNKEEQHIVLAKYTGELNQQFAIFDRAIAAAVSGKEGTERDPENPALVLEPENPGKPSDVILKSSKLHPTQWFLMADQTIQTRSGKLALEVDDGKFEEGRKIVTAKYDKDSAAQKFIPVTVYDKKEEDEKKEEEEKKEEQ